MVTAVKLKHILCSHTETVNNIMLEMTNKLNMMSFDIAFTLLIKLVSLFNSSGTGDAVILPNITEPPKRAGKLKAKALCHSDALVRGGVYLQSG